MEQPPNHKLLNSILNRFQSVGATTAIEKTHHKSDFRPVAPGCEQIHNNSQLGRTLDPPPPVDFKIDFNFSPRFTPDTPLELDPPPLIDTALRFFPAFRFDICSENGFLSPPLLCDRRCGLNSVWKNFHRQKMRKTRNVNFQCCICEQLNE